MKFISVRDLRGKSADVWKDLPGEREMIITNNGRPVDILAALSESNLEESLSALEVDLSGGIEHLVTGNHAYFPPDLCRTI